MNLADAIRKAASRGFHEQQTEPEWAVSERPAPTPVSQPVFETEQGSDMEASNKKSEAPVFPSAYEQHNPAGNAVRLEIFLSGEQMTAMLKAIMAGQHSVLTLREAASYLRISSSTLLKLAEDGEIPAVEIDGRYRFPKSNLDEWLAVQSMSGEDERDVA